MLILMPLDTEKNRKIYKSSRKVYVYLGMNDERAFGAA
jgi:hypothetical protein